MHRRLRSSVVILLFVSAVVVPLLSQDMKPLSSTLGKSITASGRKRVAVVDFTDLQGNVTELGRFLAEEFSIALVGEGKGFQVVDRTHLKAILQEHKLATSGLIDPLTARKLGQFAGVDAIVTGTITPFGDTVRLSAKLLDTESASLLGASTADVPKTKAVEELLGRGIGSELPSGPSTAKPQPVAAKSTAVQQNNFEFTPRGCMVKSGAVTCFVSVSNKSDENREFDVRTWDVALVDDRGNQYKNGNAVRLGAEGNRQTLVPELPVNISITVENIVPSATTVSFIVGYSYTKGGTWQQESVVAVKNMALPTR